MNFGYLFHAASRLAAGVILSTALGAGAWAENFSDEQQKEIGELVKRYLLTNPEVLRDAFEELERRETLEKEKLTQKGIADNAGTLYRSKLSYVAGNPKGDVSMVEFFDYNCGFCKRAFDDVLAILRSDRNLRFIVKEFPILGESSVFASRAAIASKEQGKYWDFHVALMQTQGTLDRDKVLDVARKVGLDVDKLLTDMEAPGVSAEIDETHALAEEIGVNGTPAFIIDDELLPGAMGLQALRRQVTSVRESGGCKVC